MHTERDLVIPAILALRVLADQNDYCTTTSLRTHLVENVLVLDQYDTEELDSGVIRIDQIIRNLKCNYTLSDMKLVEYCKMGFILTRLGKTIPEANLETLIDQYATTPHAFAAKPLTRTDNLSLVDALAKCLKKKKIAFTIAGNIAIKAKLKTLVEYTNDHDRVIAVAEIINEHASARPDHVKPNPTP